VLDGARLGENARMTEETQPQTAPGDDAPPARDETGTTVCPDCQGSGRQGGGDCPTCNGTGQIEKAVGGG
jgi:DnaJ-class molecular chaperone